VLFRSKAKKKLALKNKAGFHREMKNMFDGVSEKYIKQIRNDLKNEHREELNRVRQIGRFFSDDGYEDRSFTDQLYSDIEYSMRTFSEVDTPEYSIFSDNESILIYDKQFNEVYELDKEFNFITDGIKKVGSGLSKFKKGVSNFKTEIGNKFTKFNNDRIDNKRIKDLDKKNAALTKSAQDKAAQNQGTGNSQKVNKTKQNRVKESISKNYDQDPVTKKYKRKETLTDENGKPTNLVIDGGNKEKYKIDPKSKSTNTSKTSNDQMTAKKYRSQNPEKIKKREVYEAKVANEKKAAAESAPTSAPNVPGQTGKVGNFFKGVGEKFKKDGQWNKKNIAIAGAGALALGGAAYMMHRARKKRAEEQARMAQQQQPSQIHIHNGQFSDYEYDYRAFTDRLYSDVEYSKVYGEINGPEYLIFSDNESILIYDKQFGEVYEVND
jgi:hypothetical protein